MSASPVHLIRLGDLDDRELEDLLDLSTRLKRRAAGEKLSGRSVGLLIGGAIMGSVLFRLLVAIALRWGLNPNDLKLVTALFVLGALVLPDVLARLKSRNVQSRKAASR